MRIEPLTPVLLAGSAVPETSYDADIIILALNRFDDTLAAVNSALRQGGVDFHIAVLDQGSDPLVRLGFASAFGGLRNLSYFAVPMNLGVAGGRNLLSTLGNGRIIVALDNDAVFENDTVVAGATRAFDETPKLGALGFNILENDGVHLDRFSWGYPARLMSRFNGQFDTTTFVGAGCAIRRTAWLAAGGYDPGLFFTWEEYDFSLRAIAQGWIIRYDGSLRVIHKISPESRFGWDSVRTRFFVRNRLAIARKWNASWVALLPRICGYLIRGVLARRLAPTLFGIIDAIRTDSAAAKARMTPAMRDYLLRNDRRHRGNWRARLRLEVFGRAKNDPSKTKFT